MRRPVTDERVYAAVELCATNQKTVAKYLGVSKPTADRLLRRAGCRKIWVTPEQLTKLKNATWPTSNTGMGL